MGNPAGFVPQTVIDPPVYAGAYELLARCAQSLSVLEEWAINQTVKDDIDEVITVTAGVWLELRRKGRRFNRVWAGASTPCTIDNLIGGVSITLQTGWNDLNLADGARIQANSGSANLLYRCSDAAQSGVLV